MNLLMKKNIVKLSLCMIVKNEEKFLSKCLQSVSENIQEIVIVDTGSSDETKQIARQFTNCVYDFLWCDDFSKARNFSLSKASNDWVLVLDADEIVSEFELDSVIEFAVKNPFSVGRIKRINHLEDKWGKRTIAERINRFFNRQFFHYQGIIHEQVAHKEKNYDYSTCPIGITVDHLGYGGKAINIKAKTERNAALLKQAIKVSPNDPYFYYQLGKTYFWAKDYDQACLNFRQALSLPVNFAYEYMSDLVESYGYALINNQKYADALELENYEKYYKNSPDYLFLMGLIYMNNAQFTKAIETFLKCTGKKEGKASGVTSYFAFYNIGIIYECLGLKKEAAGYYGRCGDYEPARTRLNLLN